MARQDARVIPIWRDQCLVVGEPASPVRLVAADAARVRAQSRECVLLGFDDSTPVFAVDVSALTEAEAITASRADAVSDVRAVVGALPSAEAAIQAYARGILHWHRNQRFCGACGCPTAFRDGGHLRTCDGESCGRLLFPRLEPAVIVLVQAPGTPSRCLLARHKGAAAGAYSTLAGFVEVGESLEDAVRREIAEEAGVTLDAVTYQASQAWPFPAGLMIGFRALAVDDTVCVDGDELIEARWFTRAELAERAAAGHQLGRVDSIDRYLLHSWLTPPFSRRS